jgi:hypothetical protein
LAFQIPWIIGDSVETSNQASLKSARAGRASRAGARAGRIVRLVRMVKLYKYYTKNEDEFGTNSKVGSGSRVNKQKRAKKEDSTDIMEELEYESHVGAAMSDITTRRVIVLVLVMLIIVPLLSYSAVDVSPDFGGHVFHRMVKANISSPGVYSDGINTALDSLKNQLDLVHLVSDDVVYYKDKSKLDSLRSEEIADYLFRSYATTPSGERVFVITKAAFDNSRNIRQTALYSIYLTIFILFLLVVSLFTLLPPPPPPPLPPPPADLLFSLPFSPGGDLFLLK